jgi:hypothetical protein
LPPSKTAKTVVEALLTTVTTGVELAEVGTGGLTLCTIKNY